MNTNELFKLIRNWVTNYLPRSRRLSPHTIRSYKTALQTLLIYLGDAQHTKLSHISFEMINHTTISEFLTWLMETKHLSASSANQRLAAIKSFLSYCAAEDPALVAVWLDIKNVRPARVPTPVPDALSMAAIQQLIRTPGQHTVQGLRDTTLMLVLFDAAARVQELLDLTPADIDTTTGNGQVTLYGKRQRTRTVPIMDKTGDHLRQYLEVFHPDPVDQQAPLFYTVRGEQRQSMSQDNVNYLLNKYAQIARQHCTDTPARIHAHQLRHSRAMQMLRAEVPLPHIKEFLGHANIATTSLYASADNAMVRQAIQKAASPSPNLLAPVWQGENDLILRLTGLK